MGRARPLNPKRKPQMSSTSALKAIVERLAEKAKAKADERAKQLPEPKGDNPRRRVGRSVSKRPRNVTVH